MKTLNSHALGMSAAVLAGLCMLLLSLLGLAGVYTGAVEIMQQWHMWYSLTPFGIVLGIVEAGVASYVGGWLFGFFYNKFAK